MKRKELQIPKDAAGSGPEKKAERAPVRKKKVVPAKQAERASVREKKPAPATKTKASSVQKAADAKKMFRKRKKQYQHIMTLLRAVIRIVNAAGRSTMYRR